MSEILIHPDPKSCKDLPITEQIGVIHLDPDEAPAAFLNDGYLIVPIVLSYIDIDYQNTQEELDNLLNLMVEIAKENLFQLVS